MKTLLKLPAVQVSLVAAAFALLIAIGVGAVLRYMYLNEEATCLAYTLDSEWLWTGQLKERGEEKDTALAQAEAIAWIEIAKARDRRQSLCPKGTMLWTLYSSLRVLVGSKPQSERWRLVYGVARDAIAGIYTRPWPPEYQCARSYRATRLRVDAKWYNWNLREVGRIGTLVLYCES